MKIAVFGTGGMARTHLDALATLPDVEVVGHVDVAQDLADAAVKKWGGRGYTSAKELLANETVDAAWVLVPPHAHGVIERTLLENKIPFMAEKPLTADRKTGEQIAEAVERHQVIAGVGYQWRAMDTIPVVREQLKETPPRMVVGTYHGPTPPPAWWRRQDQSGGQFVEQATHLFDLARFLVGKEATVKGALGHYHNRPNFPGLDVDDVSAALLQFGDDIPSVFSATCLLSRPTTLEIQLICDGVRITVSKSNTTFEYGHEFRKLEVRNNPYLAEDQAFIEAVQTGDSSKLYCSYADAARTHDLTHSILEIMRST